MKKILVTLFASLILTACVTDNNKTTSSQPEINQISDISESMRTISKKQVPANIKDGEFTGTASNGRTFKTVVKNGYVDKYFDVYHPNGKLHSHTPLVKGLAQGWSEGYTQEGKLRTKILYKNGHLIRFQVYDEKGSLIKDIKE